MLGKVLAVVLDPSFMTARILVLRSAGHAVVEASSLIEAVNDLESGDFDLVLLCHSIPVMERERLTGLIRASGSRIPIISLARNFGESDAFTNATLEDGPNRFFAGIREALSKVAKTSAA